MSSILMALQAAAGSAMLQPAGPWNVEAAKQACFVGRQFGDAGAPAMLILEPRPDGSGGRLTVIVPATSGDRKGAVKLSSHPAGATLDGTGQRAGDGEQRSVLRFTFTAENASALLAATSLTITGGRAPPIGLATQGLDRAVAASKPCRDDLLRRWGADPDAMLTAADAIRPETWVKPEDYPAAAMGSRVNGTTEVMLDVDAAGRPGACRVVVSAGHEALDAKSCSMMMGRARFARGERALRHYLARISWWQPR